METFQNGGVRIGLVWTGENKGFQKRRRHEHYHMCERDYAHVLFAGTPELGGGAGGAAAPVALYQEGQGGLLI